MIGNDVFTGSVWIGNEVFMGGVWIGNEVFMGGVWIGNDVFTGRVWMRNDFVLRSFRIVTQPGEKTAPMAAHANLSSRKMAGMAAIPHSLLR